MALYIGFDVHTQQTTFYAINQEKEFFRKGQIDTTEEAYRDFAKSMLLQDPEVSVAMETGTQCRWAAQRLLENGIDAKVYHATEVANLRPKKKQKNDMNDAMELAFGLRNGIYRSEMYMPTDTEYQMRRLCEERLWYVDLATASINKTKNRLRSLGMEIPTTLRTEKAWKSLLEKHRDTELIFYIQLHYKTFCHARETILELEKQMAQLGQERQEELDLLQTIPCVGERTAFAMVAAVGDIKRFPSSSQMASYFGAIPASYDSGDRKISGHITRTGPSYLRRLLCECAWHAIKHTNPLSAYYYSIFARTGNRKKAIVAVMHHIVRIAYQILKTREPFDAKKLRIYQEKLPNIDKWYWRRGVPPQPGPDGSAVNPNPPEPPVKRLKIQKIASEG